MNNRSKTLLLVAACLAGFLANQALAENWPRFRGPNGAGQSDAATIPTHWTNEEENWRIHLPGIGHSSPIVWDDKVIVTTADPSSGEVTVLCRRTRDGGKVWTHELASKTYRMHQRNSFASSTPATDGRHVYVATANPGEYKVTALRLADGRPAWETDLGPFESMHGFGTSPIVYDNKVILANDQLGASFLIALDPDDGGTRWKSPRDVERAAYSVPCEYRPPGQPPQLIFSSSAHGLTGVNPADGKQLWTLRVFDQRTVSSPIVAEGVVIGTCGSGGGGNYVVAVRPGSADGGRQPQAAYTIREAAPYVPTPVAYGSLVFLWSDKGIVTCIEASSGEVHWRQRVGGNYSGSPIRVGKHLYCIAEDGQVVVLAASKTFREVARTPLGQPSRATPAVANGRMYLRTESALICVGRRDTR